MAPFNTPQLSTAGGHMAGAASLCLHSARGEMIQRHTLPQHSWCLERAERLGVMGRCCCPLRHCPSGCYAA